LDKSSGFASGKFRRFWPEDMGRETASLSGHNVRMAYDREAEFNEALCARVKLLRDERDWTQEQMATALGIPYDRYRKYEYRTPIPHYLIEQFAEIVGRDIEYVLTGKSAARRRGPTSRTNRIA
jgi:hypothetical protein